MPTLSIIIPTYNGSQYIRQAIDSVIAQTYQDWELIVVDDCSTDNTQSILEEYAKQDSRIRIRSTTSRSGSAAIPTRQGAENASGEYVSILGHDDYIDSNYYSILLPLALQNKKSIITSTALLFSSNEEHIAQTPSISSSTPQKLSNQDAFIRTLYNEIFGNAAIIPRNIYIQNTCRYDNKVYMNTDEIDFQKMILSAESIFITNAIYHYRIHANSITHYIKSPAFFERLITNVEVFNLARNHIGQSHPKIVSEWQVFSWEKLITYRIYYLRFQKTLTKQHCKYIRQIFRDAWCLSNKSRFFPSSNNIKLRMISSTYLCFLLYTRIKYHLEKKRY